MNKLDPMITDLQARMDSCLVFANRIISSRLEANSKLEKYNTDIACLKTNMMSIPVAIPGFSDLFEELLFLEQASMNLNASVKELKTIQIGKLGLELDKLRFSLEAVSKVPQDDTASFSNFMKCYDEIDKLCQLLISICIESEVISKPLDSQN